MSKVEELGDDLAVQTLAAMDELGDDRFYNDVAKVIGASSPTLQEAFLTAVRIRLAAIRGQKFLDATLKAKRSGGAAPAAPRDSSAH